MNLPTSITEEKSRLYVFDSSRLSLTNKLLVVGDLHGDLESLHSILKINDPTKDNILFLGDYADRGEKGIEVIETIDSLTKKYPQNIIALKGNHEDYSSNGEPSFSPCDLSYEAEVKKGSWQKYFEKEFHPFLERLYLAAILPTQFLFVHGGISSKVESLDNLGRPTKDIETDVLWSDPFPENGERPNFRGAGVYFGEDITIDICKRLKIKAIIRSHEPSKALHGPYWEHTNKVVTINSTSVYGGRPFVLIIDPVKLSDLSYRFI